MQKKTIGFIGGGNMASAIIGGLIAGGYSAGKIICAEPDADKRSALDNKYSIATLTDNNALIAASDIIVLAVKPQILRTVCSELNNAMLIEQNLMCISIAAGVRSDQLSRWLGGHDLIVRAMPNTPALFSAGATGLFAGPSVTEELRAQAQSILNACGISVWVETEAGIDAVTALSGSGPAYFFRFVEALAEGGVKLGLPAETAQMLAKQTAYGAGLMLGQDEADPATLRKNVTSPGGTTEKALQNFTHNALESVVADAMSAARDRSIELAKLLDKD